MLFTGYWTFFSCILYNFLYNENEEKNIEIEFDKYNFSNCMETYIIKPIFYIVSYILIVIMLLLFSIVKIIKYTIEFLMDFIDKDETKLYDRLVYHQ